MCRRGEKDCISWKIENGKFFCGNCHNNKEYALDQISRMDKGYRFFRYVNRELKKDKQLVIAATYSYSLNC